MSGPSWVLALDIGSSSVRARLYGPELTAWAAEHSPTRRYSWELRDGAMTVEADRLVGLTAEVLDEATAIAERDGRTIEGVAIATFWHSLLGVDREGRPVTPVYGWGDSRAREAVTELGKTLDPTRYHGRTGCFLTPVYPAVKLAWLRQSHPRDFAAAAGWVAFGDHLAERLFGERRTSVSIASGSGLFDARSMRWDGETLEAVGVRAEQLPEIGDLEPFVGLRSQWGSRWPLLKEIAWLPAVGDGACANLGSGAVGASKPGLTVGTSAAVRVLRRRSVREAAPPAELWRYLLDREHVVTGGALSNGGNGLVFLRRIFPDLTLEAIGAALASDPEFLEGLAVVPALVDERGEGPELGVGGVVTGLRPSTSSADLAAAWLQAIARRVAAPFRALEREHGPAQEVHATGGAFNALPGWLQTFADVLGRPIARAADPEATSRGVAILAARATGWLGSLEAVPPLRGDRFAPDLERHRRHTQLAERERAVERALRALR